MACLRRGREQYQSGLFSEALQSWQEALQFLSPVERPPGRDGLSGWAGAGFLVPWGISIGAIAFSRASSWVLLARLAIAREKLALWMAWAMRIISWEIPTRQLNSTSRRARSSRKLAIAREKYPPCVGLGFCLQFPGRCRSSDRVPAAIPGSCPRNWRSGARGVCPGGDWALIYDSLGEVSRSDRVFFQQALTIAREIGNRRGEGEFFGTSGHGLLLSGEISQSDRVLRAGAGRSLAKLTIGEGRLCLWAVWVGLIPL